MFRTATRKRNRKFFEIFKKHVFNLILESSTFILPSETIKRKNIDSRLKAYMQETKKYKNGIKSNLRNIINLNMTSSSESDEKKSMKSIESSISN